METWRISPALVAAGILVNIGLGMRREARTGGARDEKIASLERRATAHGDEIDGVRTNLQEHSERLTAIETKCDIQHPHARNRFDRT